MLQETDSAQFVFRHVLHLVASAAGLYLLSGREDGVGGIPASQQVANHLRSFGHKQVFTLAVFLQLQRADEFHLVLGYHIFYIFAIFERKVTKIIRNFARKCASSSLYH